MLAHKVTIPESRPGSSDLPAPNIYRDSVSGSAIACRFEVRAGHLIERVDFSKTCRCFWTDSRLLRTAGDGSPTLNDIIPAIIRPMGVLMHADGARNLWRVLIVAMFPGLLGARSFRDFYPRRFHAMFGTLPHAESVNASFGTPTATTDCACYEAVFIRFSGRHGNPTCSPMRPQVQNQYSPYLIYCESLAKILLRLPFHVIALDYVCHGGIRSARQLTGPPTSTRIATIRTSQDAGGSLQTFCK